MPNCVVADVPWRPEDHKTVVPRDQLKALVPGDSASHCMVSQLVLMVR